MKKKLILVFMVGAAFLLLFSQCTNTQTNGEKPSGETAKFGEFESQVKWGEHLVTIAGCNDCHTPKKMTPHGPDIDSALMLSGNPAQMPDIDVNRKEMESKGLAVTGDLTTWVGPWGVSYAANLTPDSTGIGSWKEEQFKYAIREGKYKGLPNSRPLLPPMPWQMYKHMTDAELSAVFTYLKSLPPIKNTVRPPKPPVSAPPAS